MKVSRVLPVIITFLLAVQPARAESSRSYAECMEMIEKYATRHIEKGDKATEKHRRKVEKIVTSFTDGLPADEDADSRVAAIVDRLVEQYRPEEHRKSLITETAEKSLAWEDTDDFRCDRESKVRHAFINRANKYEARLKEIEDAIRERLDLESLKPDEGLVVVSFRARGYAEHIVINRLGGIGGGIKFGPINNDEYFRVLKVKAGTYEWNKIWSSGWLYRTSLYVKRGDFKFTVEAGRLNYTGQFIYRNHWLEGTHASVRDRASVVLALLEERYPELLEEYGVVNGLNPDDRFFEFYLTEKRAALANDDSA